MAHEQIIPQHSLFWEHLRFEGRRIGAVGDDNQRRYWGVIYAGFASSDDADAFPESQPVTEQIKVVVNGNLVDRFFWDPNSKTYTQTEAQVGAMLAWFLTGNPTEAELASTTNMKQARSKMLGTALFGGAITVTALPDVRAAE